MSLIGATFLYAVLALTVAAFVGLVVAWPRLSGRTVRAVSSRTGLLLGVNLLVLLTAATQLNAQFLFFTSWSDLTGSTGPATSVTVGAPAARSAETVVRSGRDERVPRPSARPAVPVRSGVATYRVHGAHSGLTGEIVVRFPPGYGRGGSVTYPVLEALGGYPGSPQQWIRTLDLGRVLSSAATARQVRPALVVSPQIEFPAGVDTECVDGGPGRAQVETWLARDVPDWVARTFPVATTRASWATIGFSAGGWCAAMLTMLHPARYSAAVVLGGYFAPDFGSYYEPFPLYSAAARRYDLVRLAGSAPPPVALWLQTSRRDRISYSSSSDLLRNVRAPLSVHAVVLRDAGHRLSVWRAELPAVVSWLGADVPGFSPEG